MTIAAMAPPLSPSFRATFSGGSTKETYSGKMLRQNLEDHTN